MKTNPTQYLLKQTTKTHSIFLTGRFGMYAVILMLFLLFTAAVNISAPHEVNADSHLTSQHVREGMHGYGLSVFKGTTVERFPLVVMGRLKSSIAGRDMILVKVTGGYPVHQQTGIIAGMSGSPVYIDGKLIGAIGYGWPFNKEAIAGVTPIEAMLLDLPGNYEKEKPQKNDLEDLTHREYNLNSPVTAGGREYSKVVVSSSQNAAKFKHNSDTMVLTPVPSLLELQGFSSVTIDKFKDQLEQYGLHPVAVPSGNRVQNQNIPQLKPGSAVGISFIEGDLFIGGNGTLTYRKGDTILAFGHPLMSLGKTSVPLNAAYIEGVLPSIYRPIKFSSSLGIVGTLVEDRAYAVSAELGKSPPMIPMVIDVIDHHRNQKRRLNLRCMDHPYFTPVLISMAGVESISAFASIMDKRSADISYEIHLKGYEKIQFTDYAAGTAIQHNAGGQMIHYMRTLADHSFEPLQFEKVYMKINLHEKMKAAYIEEVSTQLPRVSPGDELEVRIRLRTEGGETVIKQAYLKIPPDVNKGEIKIGVTGGNNSEQFDKKLDLLPLEPVNISQLVDKVRKQPRNNEILVKASFPKNTITYAGERLMSISKSKGAILHSSPRSSVGRSKDYYSTTLEMPYFINGEEFINIGVSERVPASQDGFDTVEGSGEDFDTPIESDTSFSSMSNKSGMNTLQSKLRHSLGFDTEMIMVSSEDGSPQQPTKSKKENDTGSRAITWATPRDHFQGVFENTTISEGIITLGRNLERIYFSKNPFIFAAEYDPIEGKIYAAESPSGKLLQLEEGKEPVILGRTREILVTSIARDPSGIIYVGTGPNGRIFKYTPQKDFSLFATLDDQIIWDLKLDNEGGLLAATGNSGKVYRIDNNGKANIIFNSPSNHIHCLERGKNGEIYAGSAIEGIIYIIDSEGGGRPFFKTLGESVDALLYDDGSLWAASDELLYRIGYNGGKKVYVFPESGINTLAKDSEGRILAGTSDLGRVYRINKNDQVENLFESAINQVLKIIPLDSGDLIIATANPGKVLRVSRTYTQKGFYLTSVMDTGKVSQFGNVQWLADIPKSSSITFQSRTGNSITPDSSWSEWSLEYSHKDGQKVMSPPGRYIQLRANISSQGELSPNLYSIRVFYSNQNLAPVLLLDSPQGGEKWSGTKDINWKSFIANPETLSFNIFYSDDDGENWSPISQNVNADIQKRNTPADTKKPMPKSIKWHTKRVKDGRYIIKIEGFDRSDPENPNLSSRVISRPFIVSNKEPEITIISSTDNGNRGLITGFVKSYKVNVKEVLYKIDKDDWAVAQTSDGVYDDSREKFHIYLNNPYPKRFNLEIKATDEAGNSTTFKQRISLSPAEKKVEQKVQDNQ